MKRIILISIFVLSVCPFLLAQLSDGNSDRNGTYRFDNIINLTPCNSDGIELADDDNTYLSRTGQLFRVISSNDSFAVIVFLDYTVNRRLRTLGEGIVPKTDAQKDSLKTGDYRVTKPFFIYNYDESKGVKYQTLPESSRNLRLYGSGQRYFKIPIRDLERHATEYSKIASSLAFGILNLPFKYRPQGGQDFAGSLNISNALGITWWHQSWRRMTYTTVLSYGISSTLLDSTSVTSNHERLASANQYPSLTLAFGQLITRDNVQIGIFIGLDRLSKQNQNTFGWKYQGNVWFSVGFGYSIFSIEKESKKQSKGDAEQK